MSSTTTALTAATSVAGSDLAYAVASSNSRKITFTNLWASLLALAGTVTAALSLGTGGSIGDAGPITATGALTKATHSGRVILTSGNITIPNAAGDVGMGGTIIGGGAHTITFNSLASAALASGDIVSYYVQSTTVIHAVKTLAANKVTFA